MGFHPEASPKGLGLQTGQLFVPPHFLYPHCLHCTIPVQNWLLGKILFEERIPLPFFFFFLTFGNHRSDTVLWFTGEETEAQRWQGPQVPLQVRTEAGTRTRSWRPSLEARPCLGSCPLGVPGPPSSSPGRCPRRAKCFLCLTTSSALPHACLDNFFTCSFTSSP